MKTRLGIAGLVFVSSMISAQEEGSAGPPQDEVYHETTLASAAGIQAAWLTPDPPANLENPADNFVEVQTGKARWILPVSRKELPIVTNVTASMVADKAGTVFAFLVAGVVGPHAPASYLMIVGVTGTSLIKIAPMLVLDQRAQLKSVTSSAVGRSPWGQFRVDYGDDFPADYVVWSPEKAAFVTEPYTDGFASTTLRDGDVYVISFHKQFKLNDKNVNLRSKPSTQASVVKQLSGDATFEILDRTELPEVVGGESARWYRVKVSGSGEIGWLFGVFISH